MKTWKVTWLDSGNLYHTILMTDLNQIIAGTAFEGLSPRPSVWNIISIELHAQAVVNLHR